MGWNWRDFWHWLTKKSSKIRAGSNGEQSTKQNNYLKFKEMEKILKELECPICFNTCTPPIYTCQNGHIICTSCKQNITNCPTCREKFSGTRNFFAEHFIAQYSQSCKFARDGCYFLKWKGDDMKGHERNCYYRPIPCIVPSCTNAIRYKCLLGHAMDTHKVCGSETLPAYVTYHTDDPLISDRKWLPYYIKAFNSNFFLMMEVIRPHFWLWVWVQTPKMDPTNNTIFIASLKFQNDEKNLTLEWKGPVFSIRTPSDMITQDGLCFGGAETLLQNFEMDGLIGLHVNIEKKNLCTNTSIESSQCMESKKLTCNKQNKTDTMNKNTSRSVSVVTIKSKQSNQKL